MDCFINDFCDGSPIRIWGHSHAGFGGLVSVIQNSGSISFQHSMRPEQAREMAAALIACADELEAQEAAS